MKYSAEVMKATIEAILKAHGLLEAFVAADIENGFHARIQSEPYMDLVVERFGRQVTVSHYYAQNGDLVPDPDQEFEIFPDGSWFPVAIQFATGHYQRASEIREQRHWMNPGFVREQIRFANMWARNLTQQGYAQGTVAGEEGSP